jgi:transcriptional regulator GlxA family with amidase domain
MEINHNVVGWFEIHVNYMEKAIMFYSFLNLFFIILIFSIITNNKMNAQTKLEKKKVAILIYDGIYLLDFCGPLEIFNDTMLDDTTFLFEVYTVAPFNSGIKAHTNTVIIPTYSIDDCPQPDILVIPGGNINLSKNNKKIGDWIKETSSKSEITMSVCTGAFILADLGLLDGLDAITWYGAASRLQKLYPKIKVQAGKRYTDNGKIITTAGVSAGIDGALYLVGRLYGKETAIKTAKYIEYDYKE